VAACGCRRDAGERTADASRPVELELELWMHEAWDTEGVGGAADEPHVIIMNRRESTPTHPPDY
jgi:hypothetical protein